YMIVQPKAAARENAPIIDEPETLASPQIELVLEPIAEPSVEPVISAHDFITQTINQHSPNLSVYGLPSIQQDNQHIEFERTSLVHTDTAVPLLVEDEPKHADIELLQIADQDHNGLDAMLDDLAQATAITEMARQGDIISDLNQVYEALNPHPDLHNHLTSVAPEVPDLIGTTQLSAWEGESALIDEHLAEHTRSEEDSILVQAEQIIAIHLVPRSGRPLEGRQVFQLLRKYGLRFGEMDLFHRFEETSGEGAMMFSVLKYTQEGPAGFDLDTMEHEQFEGLSFFLALPGIKPLQGFDMMMSTAQRLGQECYANLLDDEMNLLSEQLKGHYRHRVLDFRPSH
ncbi:MAG TPA: cell division protein ZipA C-terminal FtsZ-binding domain-containing protein, partial [Aquirhabdus sp.]